MQKRLFLFLWLCMAAGGALSAQSLRMMDTLRRLDMENISVAQEKDTLTAAFEASAYRSVCLGIDAAVRNLLLIPEVSTLRLVVLDNAQPQLCITLPSALVRKYQARQCGLATVYREMEMTTSTSRAMKALRGVRPRYRSFGQADLVLYPGVMLANNLKTKLYRYAVDLQPALEMQLWKGAMLRAQVCLPLANNEEGRWDCIRPGFVTLSQSFRWADHWQGRVTAGNFSDSRQGVSLALGYFSSDGRLSLGAEGGLTGISHLYGSDCWLGKWKRLDGRLSAAYYLPVCNTLLKAEAGRFLYGDYGARGTLSRYFGEYTVGVYALYTDGEKNAGFHFSIPLPGKKRTRHGGFRVMPPSHFAFRYDMRSGNDYARRRLGEGYATEPVPAADARFCRPDYVRFNLLLAAEKEERENREL